MNEDPTSISQEIIDSMINILLRHYETTDSIRTLFDGLINLTSISFSGSAKDVMTLCVKKIALNHDKLFTLIDSRARNDFSSSDFFPELEKAMRRACEENKCSHTWNYAHGEHKDKTINTIWKLNLGSLVPIPYGDVAKKAEVFYKTNATAEFKIEDHVFIELGSTFDAAEGDINLTNHLLFVAEFLQRPDAKAFLADEPPTKTLQMDVVTAFSGRISTLVQKAELSIEVSELHLDEYVSPQERLCALLHCKLCHLGAEGLIKELFIALQSFEKAKDDAAKSSSPTTGVDDMRQAIRSICVGAYELHTTMMTCVHKRLGAGASAVRLFHQPGESPLYKNLILSLNSHQPSGRHGEALWMKATNPTKA